MNVKNRVKRKPAKDFSLANVNGEGGETGRGRNGEGEKRYKMAFISKLSDSETESCETQIWLEIDCLCGYISQNEFQKLNSDYKNILGKYKK